MTPTPTEDADGETTTLPSTGAGDDGHAGAWLGGAVAFFGGAAAILGGKRLRRIAVNPPNEE